jgi:HEPN domain-containing protein
MGPTPLWGNFVAYADQDLLSFAYLYSGGMRVPGYYHATQAVEKYLKALTLSIIDPDGETETALNNRWLHTHKLTDLAKRCAAQFPYYGEAEVMTRLTRFSEFDRVARYPWTRQSHGNGFTSADIPLLWDLIRRLRTDIPIKTDDYLSGMVVRGHHQGKPDAKADPYLVGDMQECSLALRRMFPDVDTIVRW